MRRTSSLALLLLIVVAAINAGGNHPAFAAGKRASEKDDARADPRFFQMEPFSLAVIRETGVRSRMVVSLALELVEPDARTAVEKALPRLNDAFLTDLYGVAALPWPGGRSLDPELVKHRLLKIAKRILGPGKVKAVLIRDIYELPR